MERQIITQLLRWKESPRRKPLVMKGARQVGKTYILKEFGRRHYKNVAYVNCDHNELVRDIFKHDFDMQRVLMHLEAITHERIVPDDTLIIIDEIQELEHGLAALKYFCEDIPEYHVAVAGSLLGISLHATSSFPVGKVDFLQMYPMNFEEFLMANGEDILCQMLAKGDFNLIKPLRLRYIEMLRQYYYVGGMPEVVQSFVEQHDVMEVRRIQQAIVDAYLYDISKHAPSREVMRITQVFRSIHSQLARENKKFIYGAVKKGGRAAEFEVAIQWLMDCGIVHKITRITKPVLPLGFYEDISAFKLYLLDCGLLACMAGVPASQIFIGNNAFVEFKGAFTEQYVLQQLKCNAENLIYYFSNNTSTLEIEFVVQHGDIISPIEVKAEENLRSKSLRNFCATNPDLRGIRISMADHREQDWMTNYPLYYATHALKNE